MSFFLQKKNSFYFYFSIMTIILLIVIYLIYAKIRNVPDLVFYYSDDNTISKYSKLKFGSTLILNISGNITDKSIKTNQIISEEDVKAGKCGKILPKNATKVIKDHYVYEFYAEIFYV